MRDPVEPLESRALRYVEANWVDIWRRINLGGLVQHQSELSFLLAVFAEEAHLAAARRCAEMLETEGVMLPIVTPETKQDRCVRFARAFAQKIRDEFGLPASNPSPAVPGGDEK
jgi:hypothetical protein